MPARKLGLPGQVWPPGVAGRLAARTLAYLGDAVFETGIRLRLVEQAATGNGCLTGTAVPWVRASHQAGLLAAVMAAATPAERELLVRWRNARQPTGRTRGPRGAYARSTAFEAWIGYLFLIGDQERLEQCFALATADPAPAGPGSSPAGNADDGQAGEPVW